MNTIGFIGLGIMGCPMAKNLLKSGYHLRIYARKQSTLDAFIGDAVTVCSNPADVGKEADICIIMVSDTPDVEEVVLGPTGVIHTMREHCTVIDMSTISVDATRAMAEQLKHQNIQMLDAPVSGGEQGAIDGTLSIMVGGSEQAFQKAYPLFEILGKNIIHIGDNGAGQVAKLCNQIQVAQTIMSTAEVIEFAIAAGVNPKRVREALLGGFAYSKILEVHGLRMLDNDFTPGFKANLHLKDLKIASKASNDMRINLQGLEQTTQYMSELVKQGDGELDSSAMSKIVCQKAKTTSKDRS